MTELDELKQRLEIEELRGRLSAAEKQISILTDTLATLTEIQTSDRLGSYINSQVRLLKAAEFLNSVSDGEKIAPQLQRQSVEQAGLRKAELDEHISRTVQLSQEKSLHTVDSRIANAVDNWQSSTSAQDPKLFTYRNEGDNRSCAAAGFRRRGDTAVRAGDTVGDKRHSGHKNRRRSVPRVPCSEGEISGGAAHHREGRFQRLRTAFCGGFSGFADVGRRGSFRKLRIPLAAP